MKVKIMVFVVILSFGILGFNNSLHADEKGSAKGSMMEDKGSHKGSMADGEITAEVTEPHVIH